jgi:hypothetical protein
MGVPVQFLLIIFGYVCDLNGENDKCTSFTEVLFVYFLVMGRAVAQLVEALRYKPEDRGFDSRLCH